MSYVITDNINFIEVDNGISIFYLKKKFDVDIIDNVIHLENCDCPKDFIDVPFSEITSPVAANITAMRAVLQGYNNTNGATSEKQDSIITSLGTDGATPPSIIGTGVRGWLRAIYVRLFDGLQKSIVRGGAKGTTTAADVTSTPVDANTQALHVQVVNNTSTTPPQSSQIGDYTNADKVFSVSSKLNAALSSVENPMFLIRNPTGSGKKIYIVRGEAGTTDANITVDVRVFSSPTVTANGTVVTPVNNKVGSVAASSVLANSLPTVSANGSVLRDVVNGQNSNSVPFAQDSAIIMPENSAILITARPSTNGREVAITLIWIEI